MKKIFIILFVVFGLMENGLAQSPPRFWEDVQVIKKYDKIYVPPANPILFIGSSSIRKWDDLERTFAPFSVMNRGIGGTVINDIIFYLNDIVFPYHPRQIFIYVGENDLTDSLTTADSIFERTKHLIINIRSQLPQVPICYISIKPSPVRDKYREKAVAANALISQWITTQKNISFVDIFPAMLHNGKSMPELFVSDMLHMNAKGYAIWRAKVEPYLLKK